MPTQQKKLAECPTLSILQGLGANSHVNTFIEGSCTKTKGFPIDVFVDNKKEKNSESSLQTGGMDLAKEFTKIYNDLYTYTLKACIKLNRAIQVEIILSECYLYVYSKKEEIKDPSQLTAWCKKYIKSNLHWTNGPLIRGNSDIKAMELGQVNYDGVEISTDKTLILEWIEEWETSLTPIEKRVWNMWHHQHIRKGKEFAKWLGISVDYGFSLVREGKRLENQLRCHLKEKDFI